MLNYKDIEDAASGTLAETIDACILHWWQMRVACVARLRENIWSEYCTLRPGPETCALCLRYNMECKRCPLGIAIGPCNDKDPELKGTYLKAHAMYVRYLHGTCETEEWYGAVDDLITELEALKERIEKIGLD